MVIFIFLALVLAGAVFVSIKQTPNIPTKPEPTTRYALLALNYDGAREWATPYDILTLGGAFSDAVKELNRYPEEPTQSVTIYRGTTPLYVVKPA